MELAGLIQKLKQQEKVCVAGLRSLSKAYALSKLFLETRRPLCVILPHSKDALSLFEDLKFFLRESDLLYFQGIDMLPYYGLSPNPDIMAERQAVLYKLACRETPYLLVSSLSAALHYLPPKEIFIDHYYHLKCGQEIDLKAFEKDLITAGYRNVPIVEDPGTFSRRGGILDIFSPHHETGHRIELFGDEIESIRKFHLETQRSRESLQEIELIAANQVVADTEKMTQVLTQFKKRADDLDIPKPYRASFVDAVKEGLQPVSQETYLPLFYEKLVSLQAYLPRSVLMIHFDTQEIQQQLETHLADIKHAFETCETIEKVISPDELVIQELVELGSVQLGIETLASPESDFIFQTETHESLRHELKLQTLNEDWLGPLKQRIHTWQKENYHLLITASSHPQYLRLKDLLERADYKVKKWTRDFEHFLSREPDAAIYLQEAKLNEGLLWPAESLVVLTDQEIFGKKIKKRHKKEKQSEAFNTFEELKSGDYIVHEEHGLGQYQDLVHLDLGGLKNDFLLIEYLGGDKLYLPVYRLNLVSRYQSGETGMPILDKLGGFTWEKTLSKVKKSIKALAGQLLKLYAERATLQGFAFDQGAVMMEEFEASFPFEETPDQDRAIQEVLTDMREPMPMDRLVCGDVGYGKTEVAMRAAYQAVLCGKQVLLIVPTTVLAGQHYQSFLERFEQTSVNIKMLSRFLTPKDQKQVIQDLFAGRVDIAIGTHRLLSADVACKDLGLLIIDEEHRFGVAHKEKIKHLKRQVDVLTLTATPIPRTLNMSLSGVRDLSLINTPPADRLSIRTFVADFNESLIREAIMREIGRGGQVYFLHNEVKSIYLMLDRLKQMVPEAKIGVGHGQMKESDLEKVMLNFVNHEINVCLCTTIIESGLDVPKANTMIINRADKLGLAQLYQIRGRVGRSNVRAYCYLLSPEEKTLSKKARARLEVLQRYTELGSGFKIASHDMELRGVGNFLGEEQSGQVASVGYEMYTRLLDEAIMELQGQSLSQAPDPELKLRISSSIPEDYVVETSQRLTLYKRLAMANDAEKVEKISEEIEDRFGPLPVDCVNLVLTMKLHALAKGAWLRVLRQETRRWVLAFDPNAPLNMDKLKIRCDQEPGRFKWISPFELAMGFKEGKEEASFESIQQLLLYIGQELMQSFAA